MKVLIIAAHGSRREESNLEVAELADRLGLKLGKEFDIVTCAFLQFASPSIETKMAQLIQKGAKTLVIFPFFIASGSHIREDLPDLVKKMTARYPDVNIRLTRHLGKIETVADIIADEVRQ